MRLDLAFVDLYHRPQRLRLASCFGWLHHPSVLRGLTPPACTNLHSSNSIQMCERNPTLSVSFWHPTKSAAAIHVRRSETHALLPSAPTNSGPDTLGMCSVYFCFV